MYLSVNDLIDILPVSKGTAYKIADRCDAIQLHPASRKLIPLARVIEYLRGRPGDRAEINAMISALTERAERGAA